MALTNKKAKKKKAKKAKASLSAAALADKQFRRDIDELFQRSGFKSFVTDGKDIKVGNRKGEIDYVFATDNVMVICERTAASDVWTHLQKKNLFFSAIASDPVGCIGVLRSAFPAIDAYVAGNTYDASQYHLRILYCSIDPVEEEHKNLIRWFMVSASSRC